MATARRMTRLIEEKNIEDIAIDSTYIKYVGAEHTNCGPHQSRRPLIRAVESVSASCIALPDQVRS
jgi:hypothetical protein